MVPKASASASTSTNALTSITTHELSLSTSPFSPNPLLPLISLTRHPSPDIVHKAIYALYRSFTKIAEDGRLFAFKGESGQGREDRESKEAVAKWVRERLEEYLTVLRGLMRDSEPALRKSSINIYISLLPPISSALTAHLSSSSDPTPLLSLPHVRHLLDSLLFGSSSQRGAKFVTASPFEGKWGIVSASQWRLALPSAGAEDPNDEEEGKLSADPRIPEDVKTEFVQKLIDNDDLRWAFFHSLSRILEALNNPLRSPVLPNGNDSPPGCLADNVVMLLLPLQNLPKEKEDINTFWCPHVGKRPSKRIKMEGKSAKARDTESNKKSKKDREEGQDWLAFYDSPSSSDTDSDSNPTGTKRKRSSLNPSRPSQHAQIHSPQSHQSLFTRSWLSLLSLPLSPQLTRSILLQLHSTILPNLLRAKVIRLTDWLGSLVDQGGALGLLALNGLYVLMRDWNLEYQGFYKRLYGLMGREVMFVKYRARFFRLTENFLSSPLLPAALVASFIKRLAQLSLTAPPAAIIMIIPFIYNLLKKHPACMMMLQSITPPPSDTNNTSSSNIFTDPFDANETDPSKTGALDSSLWELKSLQKHYLSHVATMAKLFGEVFTKPEFVMEDFLDHGYASLLETEMGRKIRSDPALAIESTKNPFPALKESSEKEGVSEEEEDYVPEEGVDLISEMWSFGVKV